MSFRLQLRSMWNRVLGRTQYIRAITHIEAIYEPGYPDSRSMGALREHAMEVIVEIPYKQERADIDQAAIDLYKHYRHRVMEH